MSITFTLHDEAVNDRTARLQTGDNANGFAATDVAYSSLPAPYRTYLETMLGLSSTVPTNGGVAHAERQAPRQSSR